MHGHIIYRNIYHIKFIYFFITIIFEVDTTSCELAKLRPVVWG